MCRSFATTNFSKIFSGSHSIQSPCRIEARIPDSVLSSYQQRPEDGDSVGPWNVGQFLLLDPAACPRRNLLYIEVHYTRLLGGTSNAFTYATNWNIAKVRKFCLQQFWSINVNYAKWRNVEFHQHWPFKADYVLYHPLDNKSLHFAHTMSLCVSYYFQNKQGLSLKSIKRPVRNEGIYMFAFDIRTECLNDV